MNENIQDYTIVYPIPVEQAEQFARENIADIRYVYDFAYKMGYSRSYFYTKVSEAYNMKPVELLREVRFGCIREEILAHQNETSRAIAQRVGLRDEQALYKFLVRYWDTNFTLLRRQLLYNAVEKG